MPSCPDGLLRCKYCRKFTLVYEGCGAVVRLQVVVKTTRKDETITGCSELASLPQPATSRRQRT
eukprot:766788-Hanusia_phi.AAC.3